MFVDKGKFLLQVWGMSEYADILALVICLLTPGGLI
jgi:hypothetical protein